MTIRTAHILIGLALAAVAGISAGQGGSTPTRGQLLYNTHCVTCHDTQMHWRQNRKTTDWKTLVAEVRHWQASEKLAWSEPDITQVARYLNDTIYRYPLASLAQRE